MIHKLLEDGHLVVDENNRRGRICEVPSAGPRRFQIEWADKPGEFFDVDPNGLKRYIKIQAFVSNNADLFVKAGTPPETIKALLERPYKDRKWEPRATPEPDMVWITTDEVIIEAIDSKGFIIADGSQWRSRLALEPR